MGFALSTQRGCVAAAAKCSHGSKVCATAFPSDAEISIGGCKWLLQSVVLVSVRNLSRGRKAK